MKKLLCFAPLLCVLLIGCDNSLNKTVLEPLPLEDLQKAMNKDPMFEDMYQDIRKICDKYLKDDVEKAKYLKLTYKEVVDAYKLALDSNSIKPYTKEWEKEWKEKYGVYDIKIDSALNYWEKYKKENALENYVDIELAKLDKEYYMYSKIIENVNVGFKLTPKKGKIEQLVFTYHIKQKDDNNIYDEDSMYWSAIDASKCRTTSPFSESVIRYWEANIYNRIKFENHTVETFKQDYNIYTKVESVTIDGVTKTIEGMGVPESVDKALQYNKKVKDSRLGSVDELLGQDEGYYKKDVAKELFNANYTPLSEYMLIKKLRMIREKYPLGYQFLEEGSPIKGMEYNLDYDF